MQKPTVIRAYQALHWGEIAFLGVLVAGLGAVVETAFITAHSLLIALTSCMPFVAAALAVKHYEWEPTANRVSAAFVAAFCGMALQVFVALLLSSL